MDVIKMEQQSRYQEQEGRSLSLALEQLPTAELYDLYALPPNTTENPMRITDKAIWCMNNHVGTVSPHYKLVQHRDAFMPILMALDNAGMMNYQFSTWAVPSQAFLAVTVLETNGIRIGFRARSRIDGGHAISFGFKAVRTKVERQLIEKHYVTVWGVRQVCTNGMMMKIPLDSIKYFTSEQRRNVEILESEQRRIAHIGDTTAKLRGIQAIVTGFLDLREPVAKMIVDANEFPITMAQAEEILKQYFGKRKITDIMVRWKENEEPNLWGLYNAATYLASHHPMAESTREGLLVKAADMLTGLLERVEGDSGAARPEQQYL